MSVASPVRDPDAVIFLTLTAATCAAALAAGYAAGHVEEPGTAAMVAIGLALVLLIAARPLVGAILWLVVGPLIVGVARGTGLLVLRPNEALLLLVLGGVALNLLWRSYLSERVLPRFNAVDGALLLFTLAGTAVPLLIRFGRGLPVSAEDVLYAIVFVKYLLLYAVFRVSVKGEAELALALKLALFSGLVVGMIGIFQVQGLFGVNDLLTRYFDSPFEGSSGALSTRASSTIASAFGLADMMAMCLAISLAALFLIPRHRGLMAGMCIMFAAAGLAAGSFSGVIGLAVVTAIVGIMLGRTVLLAAVALPAALLGVVAFWPVIAARLEGFDRFQGLPRSWLGRLENLERFFWPELATGFNWLLGVRPAARVAAPEQWRDWVYIESGYTWLLWTGGLPLLLAFFGLFAVAAYELRRVARERPDGWPCVASRACLAALGMICVLMLFDPHLTVRGSADLFFPLLALALAPAMALVHHVPQGSEHFRK